MEEEWKGHGKERKRNEMLKFLKVLNERLKNLHGILCCPKFFKTYRLHNTSINLSRRATWNWWQLPDTVEFPAFSVTDLWTTVDLPIWHCKLLRFRAKELAPALHQAVWRKVPPGPRSCQSLGLKNQWGLVAKCSQNGYMGSLRNRDHVHLPTGAGLSHWPHAVIILRWCALSAFSTAQTCAELVSDGSDGFWLILIQRFKRECREENNLKRNFDFDLFAVCWRKLIFSVSVCHCMSCLYLPFLPFLPCFHYPQFCFKMF